MKLKALSLAVLVTAPFVALAEGPSVMEIIIFDAQPGATAEAITAALGPIETKMGQYGTLIARSVSEGPAGKWTMVNYWPARAAMHRVNQEALTWPEFGALPGVANLETLQMQQLDVDTTVGLGE